MGRSLQIKTPSRLHFTLIDLNAELGRVDGGIGVALNTPLWDISVKPVAENPDNSERITEILNNINQHLKLQNNYQVTLRSEIPRHVGLGSQTQLSLALAQALSVFEEREEPVPELAKFVGRGGTSGIGVAAFEFGGFILDGGHSTETKPEFLPSHYSQAEPAVVLAHYPTPEEWYFVIALPQVEHGAHGIKEIEIFKQHCPIPNLEVAKLTRIILMQTLPALIENNIEVFGQSLTQIQELGFKKVENELQHEVIKKVQDFYLANGAFGAGLSSFGPATYGVVEGEGAAEKLMADTKKFLEEEGVGGDVFYSNGNNNGAEIIE